MEAAVEAATSEQLLDVNWDVNMQITDAVAQEGFPQAQLAMDALRKRLLSKNPKTVLLALTVRLSNFPALLLWALLSLPCPPSFSAPAPSQTFPTHLQLHKHSPGSCMTR